MHKALATLAKNALNDDIQTLRSLDRYAAEVGVSLEHVIVAALKTVAEDYENATGNGAIPLLG